MNAQNRQEITAAPARTVADPSQTQDVGGEPLECSGFEDETPEPDFKEEQR
jgi:hypothetical protein